MRPHMVFACLGTITCSLVFTPTAQAEKVIPARIDELVEKSERIVLAKVEPLQADLDHKIRRARATVKEVWKGPKVETVEYLITPRHRLDNSKAVPGETVLLFLVEEDGDWGIAWAGHGRMTLETQHSKQYLAIWDNDVVFPERTPSIEFPGNERLRYYNGIEIDFIKELILKMK